MRILQVGNTDLVGARFNGQDLHVELCKRGYGSHHLVWEKEGDDQNTSEIRFSGKRAITDKLRSIEYELSIHSLLHPAPLALLANEHFKAAHLVHYHLIHTGWFSLAGLPTLTTRKPSLWTLHDAWPLTGHCIYPRTCDRWLTGCGSCPDLDVLWKMKRDNTRIMWGLKKLFYSKSDLDIVVASKYMLRLAQASPLTSRFRMHRIPFGIDLKWFTPGDTGAKRKKLGIVPGNTVIFLRSTLSPFKGLSYVEEALEKLSGERPLTILTLENKGLFKRHLGKHQLLDLGWVNDPKLVIDAYQAADFFLMPSTAEAFGLMAIEAMACAKPIIVFEGTSLPEVTFAPKGAIAVPMGDTDALAAAIKKLIEDPALSAALGARARDLAVRHYDWNTHVDRMTALYHEICERKACDEKHRTS